MLFNKLLVWNIFKSFRKPIRKSFTNNCIVFCRLQMFSFSLIDLDSFKHRPIDRNKENIIFLLMQELIILYGCFHFSAICSSSFE